MARGTLILIVGPSGAGKDTLLDGARAALAGDRRFVFARRVITRPAESGGEDHEVATEAEFDAREAAGEFLLSWRAHGLAYGLPASLEDDLATGRHVIANVSRAVVAEAAQRLAPVALIEVTAPRALRAERLIHRGRESVEEVEARLDREGAEPPTGVPARTVMNDGTPALGIARLIAALRSVGDGAQDECCA